MGTPQLYHVRWRAGQSVVRERSFTSAPLAVHEQCQYAPELLVHSLLEPAYLLRVCPLPLPQLTHLPLQPRRRSLSLRW